ncbi:hypothetical protein [Zophobihabitans entericus]|uniref:DUF3806 domain-containing protein n=1 Tax=Zophobihabitans entericus TaxID=1635327 RepID=A0A6G9ICN5_9GAMM|nr:hypothetical protein [Zophobihabitans entericus]QIQ21579.1 hypothetical protein IPMB12_07715 [Zophobihabitans entericus]
MATAKNELYEEIKAWSDNAILHSPAWSVNELDYSEKSLSAVEIIVDELSAKHLEVSEEQLDMIAQEYGCYMLIAAQRLYGGEFYWNEDVEQPMLIVGEPDACIVLLTWNKVKGRLLGDKIDHLAYFFEQFAADAKAPEAGKKVIYM